MTLPGSPALTATCGSLFGNGSSQSSLTFGVPPVTAHSNSDPGALAVASARDVATIIGCFAETYGRVVLVVGPTAFADITDERINAATAAPTRPKRFTGLFPPSWSL